MTTASELTQEIPWPEMSVLKDAIEHLDNLKRFEQFLTAEFKWTGEEDGYLKRMTQFHSGICEELDDQQPVLSELIRETRWAVVRSAYLLREESTWSDLDCKFYETVSNLHDFLDLDLEMSDDVKEAMLNTIEALENGLTLRVDESMKIIRQNAERQNAE